MSLGFCLADLTDVHKLLHKRLVFGRQPNLILANDVGAAVTHLDEIQHVAPYGCSREGCAHAGAARVFLAAHMDGEVGVDGGVLQAIDQRTLRVATCFRLASHQHLTHRIYGHPAGNIAGERAAHSVRYDQNQTFLSQLEASQFLRRFSAVGSRPGLLSRKLENEKAVLVAPADTTNIRFRMQLYLHKRSAEDDLLRLNFNSSTV